MNINPWRSTSVRTALEGRSFIDTKRIHIHSEQEASRFLECYGFDFNDDADKEELENLRLEAIELIEQELLGLDESIPESLKSEKDVRQYLLNASGHGDFKLAPWSGAILRVIHTLTHSHSYLNDVYHDPIRQQIFNRFEGHIHTKEGMKYLGDIKLLDIEFRTAKSRRSVAMKLMHKAENVAADIFDWIGIRFITEYRADVIDVLAYLRQQHIVTYANIKPSRSRNTLIDMDWLNACLDNGMSVEQIKSEMQSADFPPEKLINPEHTEYNQFTEVSYHSVQITCRQRIKIPQPDGKKLCFYFPFEIQMMDQKSYLQTRDGLASHKEYKKRQRNAVRKRIFPFLDELK
ncbi:TIGR04552 family protein [Colwellia sp. E2M01]|uniref:TIGR04552 family protein n=1 Tax=Colwellia sp. E2M01 TaxID=2841561 RepID=UPI001C09E74B|nr:TIGR04552 family protein [Colwellia sp. E2M01]MBU2870959.1 TIGR04552 family protein [Colwellia sp. E2M01]